MTSILILQHQRPDGEVDTYHLKAGRRYHLGRGSQCQVRVLDLKLSRQHCAFERADQDWQLVDLASTNGCSVDGERVSGSRALHAGMVVAAGSTSMLVARIADSATDPEALAAPAAAAPAPADALPEQGEAEPPRASDRLAAVASRSADESDEFEPQSAPNRATISDPLIPGQAPAAPQPKPAPTTPLDHDILATLPPGRQATPAGPDPAEIGSRTFYINVLGRRVGPLTKAQARDLKTKELRGSLTPADLAVVEAEAALGPVPANQPGGTDEQHTYYVTLLGQRVGPLSRSQARELKAKELRGLLTAEEIKRLVVR